MQTQRFFYPATRIGLDAKDSDLDTLSLYNFWELRIKLSSKSREGLP
jgi:hypothetical protein